MAFPRIDNIAIVVEDLAAAIAFFAELGLTLENEIEVEGPWVDRVVGLDGVRSRIAWMRAPDGHISLELTKYLRPSAVRGALDHRPANTLGLHRIMFEVADIDDAVARLQRRGAELLGEVVQYEQVYRLCYLRGPEGIMVALAEKLG